MFQCSPPHPNCPALSAKGTGRRRWQKVSLPTPVFTPRSFSEVGPLFACPAPSFALVLGPACKGARGKEKGAKKG